MMLFAGMSDAMLRSRMDRTGIGRIKSFANRSQTPVTLPYDINRYDMIDRDVHEIVMQVDPDHVFEAGEIVDVNMDGLMFTMVLAERFLQTGVIVAGELVVDDNGDSKDVAVWTGVWPIHPSYRMRYFAEHLMRLHIAAGKVKLPQFFSRVGRYSEISKAAGLTPPVTLRTIDEGNTNCTALRHVVLNDTALCLFTDADGETFSYLKVVNVVKDSLSDFMHLTCEPVVAKAVAVKKKPQKRGRKRADSEMAQSTMKDHLPAAPKKSTNEDVKSWFLSMLPVVKHCKLLPPPPVAHSDDDIATASQAFPEPTLGDVIGAHAAVLGEDAASSADVVEDVTATTNVEEIVNEENVIRYGDVHDDQPSSQATQGGGALTALLMGTGFNVYDGEAAGGVNNSAEEDTDDSARDMFGDDDDVPPLNESQHPILDDSEQKRADVTDVADRNVTPVQAGRTSVAAVGGSVGQAAHSSVRRPLFEQSSGPVPPTPTETNFNSVFQPSRKPRTLSPPTVAAFSTYRTPAKAMEEYASPEPFRQMTCSQSARRSDATVPPSSRSRSDESDEAPGGRFNGPYRPVWASASHDARGSACVSRRGADGSGPSAVTKRVAWSVLKPSPEKQRLIEQRRRLECSTSTFEYVEEPPSASTKKGPKPVMWMKRNMSQFSLEVKDRGAGIPMEVRFKQDYVDVEDDMRETCQANLPAITPESGAAFIGEVAKVYVDRFFECVIQHAGRSLILQDKPTVKRSVKSVNSLIDIQPQPLREAFRCFIQDFKLDTLRDQTRPVNGLCLVARDFQSRWRTNKIELANKVGVSTASDDE